eukprot:6194180-Pleurochrysis_carterae.AAC.1
MTRRRGDEVVVSSELRDRDHHLLPYLIFTNPDAGCSTRPDGAVPAPAYVLPGRGALATAAGARASHRLPDPTPNSMG